MSWHFTAPQVCDTRIIVVKKCLFTLFIVGWSVADINKLDSLFSSWCNVPSLNQQQSLLVSCVIFLRPKFST